ncbi:Gfo/Idh/MocA family oxidoreductase [Paenibacillus albiflavus]|uniref:Gfo/Idh/MocA family oxidoreductase n=1 Tax=Paenibacillus albiflavus TaxID=2545760 RepID=A0A4R4EE18_9BACL|nr:Gfo/Idh/MocA family oxidoreductase [Paenibacillus albiflavus]TCZ77687.1 Gfo/Idh/MocA family oxidoreductase [Paenibacillus albiflavus]
MLQVLVIGAGTMGTVHAEAYGTMEHIAIAGIVDKDLSRAQTLASKLNTQAFASYEDAIKAVHVDVVDVCLPTYLHKEYVLQAADAGKHVICEKPLARNLADAREMIEGCRAKGVKLFVGHVIRFFPEYREAKALLDQGGIGKTAVTRMSRVGPFPRGWENWYADYSKSGGLLLDLIIHDFDYLRWCYGEVERVYAKGLVGRAGKEDSLDYALVTLRFASGVIAHVEGSWAHETFSMKFELAGTSGIIDYDSGRDNSIVASRRSSNGGKQGVAVPESPLAENPYARELAHFLACIERDEQPIVTAEDAYEAVRIALAAIQSVETGQPVQLSELKPAKEEL